MNRYLDAIPHPWTREAIQQAIFTNFTEAREAIEDTPGGIFWRARLDLEDSLWMFDCSVTELLDEIAVFGERSQSPAFWQTADADQADAHKRAVKRYIFNCTSSLMALVDHARNFQTAYPVTGFRDHLQKCFRTPGLHSFLQCFRNYNTHWRVAEANWSIHSDFRSGHREARFVVSKRELLRWNGWSASARAYISAATDPIDIHATFAEYRRSAQDFYSWHRGAVLAQYSDTFRPYLEYKRLHQGVLKCLKWNALVSHAPKSVNPYTYIAQYLSKAQLEALLALEHGSEAQVDALMNALGIGDFCCPELRRKVASFFESFGATAPQVAQTGAASGGG
ncbi:hypothetical protein [Lysobacter sp. TY2-98]|uniref:hypothetical protein n=1 Tax=Lysobacter sp. TY2-98 TaxID=2290922 RepID=UPI0013B3BD76|nr:hypothetical protein [Lysobacter sp. TY2-98]